MQTLSTAIIGSAAQITAMRQQYEVEIQELQEKYDLKVSGVVLPACQASYTGPSTICTAPACNYMAAYMLLQAHEATFLDDAVRELQQDLQRVRQEAEDAAGQSALLMATATECAHEREAALHAEVER
jgi:hypothetical protein